MNKLLNPNVAEISVSAAYEIASSGLGVIVDVREPWELEFHPSTPGSERLPLFTVREFCGVHTADEDISGEPLADSEVNMAALIKMVNRHACDRKIVMCLCRTGRRSLEAAELLRGLGYHMAVSIAGGIIAWEEAGLPIEALAEAA